jgi:ATP-dependent DNA helicase RecG
VQALKSREIQTVAGLRHRESFQRNYLDQLLGEGWLERTIPDKPKSRLQKYRLTDKSKALLAEIRKTGSST